jgi:hypothetical protein
MRTFFRPNQVVAPIPVRVLYVVGALVGWAMLVFIYRVGVLRLTVAASIVSGPSVLLLTYFAFGGDIPRSWRERGLTRLALIPVVWFPSMVVAIVCSRFL